MITPKSPIPVHHNFGMKNTSFSDISDEVKNKQSKEDAEEKTKLSVEEAKDEISVNADDVGSVELTDEVPEDAEVHDGVVLEGTDEATDSILDAIKAEEARKAAVAAAEEDKKQDDGE